MYSQPHPYGPYPYGPPPAPRPGSVPLRPLGVSDILDGAFRTVRRNPRATLGISAVVAVLQTTLVAGVQLALYSSLSGHPTRDGRLDAEQLVSLLSSLVSILVVGAIFGGVLTGLLTAVVTEDVLGNRLGWPQLWARVRPRLLALIGLNLLIGLVEVIALLPCLAPGVWLWGIWALAVPAMMVEGTGIRASLRRSRHLVQGMFWRVWGIRALGVLLAAVVGALASVPFTLLAGSVSGRGFGGAADGAAGVPYAYVLISSVGAILTTTFTAPIKTGIDALLYVDQRMRKEGLDIALQQAAAHRAGT